MPFASQHPFHGGLLRRWIRSWPFRRQLLVLFTSLFTLAAIGDYMAGRMMRQRVLHAEVEDKLQGTVVALENLVRASLESSISSYLRGVAESSVRMANRIQEEGSAQDRQHLLQTLVSQEIVKGAYVFVMDLNGVILMHPRAELIGCDVSLFPGMRADLFYRRRGAVSSERWREPGEEKAPPKLMVGARFEPKGWIICAVAPRKDFGNLVDMDIFRSRFLAVKFGERGYPFILDAKGILVVHPFLEGTDVLNILDEEGRSFVREMLRQRNGRIEYTWKNPQDQEARPKVVAFHYLPEMDWIVASSCDLLDLRKSETTFAYLEFTYLMLLFLLTISATFLLSRSLSRPIKDLASQLEHPDLTAQGQIQAEGSREVSVLAKGFNAFLARISRDREELAVSERRHRTLFEHAVEGIFEATRNGHYLSINPRFAQMLGYTSAQEILETVSDITGQIYKDPADRERVWQRLEAHDVILDEELELLKKDGSTILVLLNARAVRTAKGELHMEGFIRDITEERKAQRALAIERQELESRVASRTQELQEGIEKLERHNTEIAELHLLTEMLQACRDLSETRTVLASFLQRLFPQAIWHLHLQDREGGFLTEWVASEGEAPVVDFPVEACWALRSGKPYARPQQDRKPPCSHEPLSKGLDHLCFPIQGSGQLHGLLQLMIQPGEDLEELSRRADHLAERLALAFTNLKLRLSLEEQSTRDPLTGCYNRRYLMETGRRELRRASRTGRPLGVVLVDLDHFKRLNDTFGHDAGDAVLRQLARFMTLRLRDSDMVIRYGGEEFLFLLPEADLQATCARAEAIRQAVADEFRVDHHGEVLSVTLSAGVAAFPACGTALEDIIKVADLRLYEAKHRGRNRTVAEG